jgi:hypothetical protein
MQHDVFRFHRSLDRARGHSAGRDRVFRAVAAMSLDFAADWTASTTSAVWIFGLIVAYLFSIHVWPFR